MDIEIIAAQHGIKTTPIEYARNLQRLLSMHPKLTRNAIAERLGKSRTFIDVRLSLLNIEDESIIKLIDSGKIKMSDAYALAKLPAAEQLDHLNQLTE